MAVGNIRDTVERTNAWKFNFRNLLVSAVVMDWGYAVFLRATITNTEKTI
jgi:hypothetical protein